MVWATTQDILRLDRITELDRRVDALDDYGLGGSSIT
jgi:hypothetical protein